MTELDNKITEALGHLQSASGSRPFDIEAYIHAFQKSAEEKARAVLEALNNDKNPFNGQRPVFVSIGGGDGTEIEYLLRNSKASHGFLIEMNRHLAALARKRSEGLPNDKLLEVFEGDAQDRIAEAISNAASTVSEGSADYIAVTCHAVIHELFDRGKDRFDPLGFFATIFEDDRISTWFTYREPGVPEKWPHQVLLKADCHPKSLLGLAEAICTRHSLLKGLSPHPQVVGDSIRVHSTLAMEILAKLFYLPDLDHEIQERSTAVHHTELINTLWLAIGETAKRDNRANIISSSAPTESFTALWQQLGIDVAALNENNMRVQLSIGESQTRVIAWRLSPSLDDAGEAKHEIENLSEPVKSETTSGSDLLVPTQALETRDDDLLNAILVSKGRAWIESADKDRYLEFLQLVVSRTDLQQQAHLFSHYLLSIDSLFSARNISVDIFSGRYEEAATRHGMDLLFRAEQMEFNRKLHKADDAASIANTLIPKLSTEALSAGTLDSYVLGTCHFVLANLLRSGGLYKLAWEMIDRAQSIFRPGIESHDTELAHCYYAKAVCTAMTGISSFDAPFNTGGGATRQFASALIQVSYSHAAWFVDDVTRSKKFTFEAEEAFNKIGAPRYARRANRLATLLQWWEILQTGKQPNYPIDTELGRAVATLSGYNEDFEWLTGYLPTLRSSTVLGLLQFAREYSPAWSTPMKIRLPRTLEVRGDGLIQWRTVEYAASLEEANRALRAFLNIPLDRRIPLLAD